MSEDAIRFFRPAEDKTYEAIYTLRKTGEVVDRKTLKAINHTHAHLSAMRLRAHSWLIDVNVKEVNA